jgi:hypothetical protein
VSILYLSFGSFNDEQNTNLRSLFEYNSQQKEWWIWLRQSLESNQTNLSSAVEIINTNTIHAIDRIYLDINAAANNINEF